MSAPPSGRLRRALLPLAAFAVFLALRAWGNGFGPPPGQQHLDERHYANVARKLSWADLNPHYFENPPLLTYGIFVAAKAREALLGEADTALWMHGGGLVRLARWISAVLGALTALVCGAAASRLLRDRRAGAATAVVAGFSFLHARDSHYGVNDVPMTFLVALSLLWAVRALRDGGARWLLLSAGAAGLAAATKYNGAVAMALPLAALAGRTVAERRQARGGARLGGQLGGRTGAQPGAAPGRSAAAGAALRASAIVLVAAAVFLAGNPYALLAREEFLAGFHSQLTAWGDRAVWGQSPDPGWLLYARATLGLLGWPHLLAALAGFGLLVRDDRRAALLLAVFPLAYLAGMLTKTLFFWRFVIPLLPFAAVAAAAAWTRLAGALAARFAARRAGAALAGLLAVSTALPLARIVQHDRLLQNPHTWMQAREWILANLPSSANLFLEGFPPAFPEGRRVWLPRLNIEGLAGLTAVDASGSEHAPVHDGGYLVTDSFYEHGWAIEAGTSFRSQFHRRLGKDFELVAEFAPGPNGDPLPFVFDAVYGPLTEIWSIERPGFTVRVWRIEPGQWRRVVGG